MPADGGVHLGMSRDLLDDFHVGRYREAQYPYTIPHAPEPQADHIPIPAQQMRDPSTATGTLNDWDPEQELITLLSEEAAQKRAPASPEPPAGPDQPPRRGDGRHVRKKRTFLPDGRRCSTVLIAVISVCVAVSMLAWSVLYTYRQLLDTAEGVLPPELARWWPLTVYGPWFVAALSILHATVQRRRARRSWGVLLAASAAAAALSVSHASHSPLSFVMFGFPPITALVCFWEIIGQFSGNYLRRKGAHALPTAKK
ncbi:DUF2637 domain-containing protein [Streptomyces sp. NPDC091377]|uniref:DUF2637 domain-containing protein n=1 Tax=Streptomyces sp. NPDC091377 TaxID=3365995 RepID=UPI00382091D2